jgi:hypothetical protein
MPWHLTCVNRLLQASTANAAVFPLYAGSLLPLESFMKRLSLLAILAVLAACTQVPTQPDIQSTVRLSRNPAGTGQPGVECGDENALTEANGFGTGGFETAEENYAGEGTASLDHANSPHAVSQYDVACFQLSNR